jgi:hypothetical protein
MFRIWVTNSKGEVNLKDSKKSEYEFATDMAEYDMNWFGYYADWTIYDAYGADYDEDGVIFEIDLSSILNGISR